MNNTEKENFDFISEEFRKSVENVTLPESLKKENIVAMLKSMQAEEAEKESEETAEKEQKTVEAAVAEEKEEEKPTKKNNIVVLRRFIALAASLIIVIAVALFARSSKTSAPKVEVVEKNPFESFDVENPVKDISSEEELNDVIEEIAETPEAKESKDTEVKAEKEDATTPIEGVISGIKGENQAVETVEVEGEVVIESVITEQSKTLLSNSTSSVEQQPDITKMNGDCIYMVRPSGNSSVVKIFKVRPAGDMKCISEIKLTSSTSADTVDECIELFISDNTLIAVMKESTYNTNGANVTRKEGTLSLFYDISDPASPKQVRKFYQEGTYCYTKISGGKFLLVTNKAITESDKNMPYIVVDGKTITPSADNGECIAAENAKESSVLFITATDMSNFSTDVAKLAVIGCGSNAGITCGSGSVYVIRLFSSSASEEKHTEIYRLALSGTSFTKSGTCSVEGSPVGSINMSSNGVFHAVFLKGNKYSAIAFDSEMHQKGSYTDFAEDCKLSVTYIGNRAYALGSDCAYVINFTDPEKITVSKSAELNSSYNIFQCGGNKIIGVTSPDSKNAITVAQFSADGTGKKSCTLAGNEFVIAISEGRGIVSDDEGKLFGIPVTAVSSDGSKRSTLMMFSAEGDSLSCSGVYNHSNSSDEAVVKAFISGDTLYTVSSSKVTAFSISEKKEINSCTCK